MNQVAQPISGFNPRAREGRDGLQPEPDADDGGFNPRAREGRDGDEEE